MNWFAWPWNVNLMPQGRPIHPFHSWDLDHKSIHDYENTVQRTPVL